MSRATATYLGMGLIAPCLGTALFVGFPGLNPGEFKGPCGVSDQNQDLNMLDMCFASQVTSPYLHPLLLF